MRFTAFSDAGETLREKVYYSVGGGFVVDENATGADRIKPDDTVLPYPFTTGRRAARALRARPGLSISGLMLENEKAFGRTEAEIRAQLLAPVAGHVASAYGAASPRRACCPAA